MAKEFSKSFYKSKEWRVVREYILMRDNYLCVMCGKPADEVHHIIHLSPQNIGDINITLNPDNLKSLCRDCHMDEHRQDRAIGKCKHAEALTSYVFDENGQIVKPPC